MHNLSQFEKNWLKLFASHTEEKLLNTHVISPGNYIGHIFFFDILPKGTFLGLVKRYAQIVSMRL